MLATYLSALIIVFASLAVGRALTRAMGWRETTWLEGAIGLAALVLVGSFTIRAFDGAAATAVVLGVLIAASAIYLRGRVLDAEDLRVAAGPILVALALASLPLLASGRIGILGVGINNDLASHLLWADWLKDQADLQPVGLNNGYPIGPHSLVASLNEVFGFDLSEAIVGLLIAVAALTALSSLAVLRELSPVRRLIGAGLVALPYLTASALAVGGFKETTMGLLLLASVLALARLERDYPGDRALYVSLGVLAAGTMSVYSAQGLYWLIGTAGLLALVGAVRALRAGDLGEQIRRAAPVVLVPSAVFLVLAITEITRARTFQDRSGVGTVIEGDGKLVESVSPLEALGTWPDSNFLAGTTGPPAYLLFGALGLAALALAGWWWLKRGSLAVPLGVVTALVIYLGTLAQAGLYVQSKVLAVSASLVMLMVVRPLLGWRRAPAAETDDPAEPASSGWGVARIGLATAFCLVAAYSSLVALRDAVVSSNDHADELSSIRERVQGDWTLSLTTDRFTDYQLRTTQVGGPSRNAQVIVPSRSGKDFRLPLDFDSVAPETLDVFDWVLVTSARYRSEPPANLRLIEATDSYELWKREGQTPANVRVFGEEARPGKVLGCRAKDLAIAGKREPALEAAIFAPPPVIGKRFSWDPGSKLAPGESAVQTLSLPPGDWALSMQYQSPVVDLTVEAAGEEFEIPAAMDGAIPFRLGEGPFWPVGEINSGGGPIEITVRADDVSAFQELIGVGREAAIGNIVATQAEQREVIPFAQACGEYVDHYTVDPGALNPDVISARRQIARLALEGRYRPQSSEDRLEKQQGRTQ